jgi:hypothetical protein
MPRKVSSLFDSHLEHEAAHRGTQNFCKAKRGLRQGVGVRHMLLPQEARHYSATFFHYYYCESWIHLLGVSFICEIKSK